jgi:N-hydroxyarylamine O-acetyltransferase
VGQGLSLASLDLDAYLERIGLHGRPGLFEVHRAHATAIPFENLDPRRGIPVSLAIEDLERKLVTERRGGYCFEQNLLLAAALQQLGMEVEPILARVRAGSPPGTIRPRSHLLLRVRDDAGVWHADVGFGLGTLLDPIPFGAGEVHVQSGWPFQVVKDGPELVLRSPRGGEWGDEYAFVPEPAPQVDIEVSNWYTSTHPRSPFVTGLVAAVHHDDGARMSVSDWSGLALTEETPAGRTVTPVAADQVPALLESRFGLDGALVSARPVSER